jgi:S1-C subfamily serine protease
VNTAIASGNGGSVGIGFAIPTNLAKPIVAQLAETGRVVRAWLGVSIQPLTKELATSFGLPDTTGALVSSVMDNSPAARVGLKPGDVIT